MTLNPDQLLKAHGPYHNYNKELCKHIFHLIVISLIIMQMQIISAGGNFNGTIVTQTTGKNRI